MKTNRTIAGWLMLLALSSLTPQFSTAGAQIVTTIATGSGADQNLFLKSDGTLWAMGNNGYGQLGDGTSGDYTNRPEQIALGNVTAIAEGAGHSLFLKNDGSLWGVGWNQYGQLGDGTYNNTNLPEQIVAGNVTAIAAGFAFSLFLKSDGSLWAMGDDVYGQLGDGASGSYYDQVHNPEQIVASNVTAIAPGAYHSLFLKSDGSLWAMGLNNDGQLGDGTINDSSLPEQIVASNVTAIAGGYMFSLFLKSDGSLWAMGDNEYGQLGDGNYSNYYYKTNLPEEIVTGGVTAIAAGGGHSLFLKSDGSLWGMGANMYGQLGDGTFKNTNRPEQILAGGVTAIAAGSNHSLFLKSDGSLWVMGYNYSGQLGDGTYSNTNQPEQIVAGQTPPALGITTVGSLPVMVWPTSATNYVLQMTTNLASGNWVTVSNGVPFIGLQLTNAPGAAFFRLH
jgi:alpha-tubulin suppressor-like RCC1 family protein